MLCFTAKALEFDLLLDALKGILEDKDLSQDFKNLLPLLSFKETLEIEQSKIESLMSNNTLEDKFLN